MYPELTPSSCIQVGDSSCQIIKKLSAGSSCVTYLARLEGGSFCVLKEFAPNWFRDFYVRDEKNNLIFESDNLFVLRQHEEEKAIFNQEVASLSELNHRNNHPNIFSCLAHDHETGRILFYTQAGMTFTQWYEKYKDMLSSACEQERTDYILASVILIRKLLAVLESVHQQLLHCDIKPDNLFIVAEDASPKALMSSSFSGTITLLDFGSAKSISDLKHAAEKEDITREELEKLFAISHTPGYAHPALMGIQSHCGTSFAMQKQYAKLIDERVDWYSSGRVLAYLLDAERTGKLNHLLGCSSKLDRTLEAIGRAIGTALSPKRGLGAKDIADELNELLGQAERALKNEAGLYELYLKERSAELALGVSVCPDLLSCISDEKNSSFDHLSDWYERANNEAVHVQCLADSGGSGKTSQLMDLFRHAQNSRTIAFYVPLVDLQSEGFLSYICRTYAHCEGQRDALIHLIKSDRANKYLFLLDGFNETNEKKKIEEDELALDAQKHVDIVITSREEISRRFACSYKKLHVQPLTDRQIVEYIGKKDLSSRMMNILRNPMNVCLYTQAEYIYNQKKVSSWRNDCAAAIMTSYAEAQLIKLYEDPEEIAQARAQLEKLAYIASVHRYADRIAGSEIGIATARIARSVGILNTQDLGLSYQFTHERWFDFFTGKHVANLIHACLNHSEGKEVSFNTLNTTYYSAAALAFAGELLEDHLRVPQLDKEAYVCSIPMASSRVDDMLSFLRKQNGTYEEKHITSNIVRMMKYARNKDMSLADFSSLNLVHTNLQNLVFSRKRRGKNRICASFKNAQIGTGCFLDARKTVYYGSWDNYLVGLNEVTPCIYELVVKHFREFTDCSIMPLIGEFREIKVIEQENSAMIYALDATRYSEKIHIFSLNENGQLTKIDERKANLIWEKEIDEEIEFLQQPRLVFMDGEVHLSYYPYRTNPIHLATGEIMGDRWRICKSSVYSRSVGRFIDENEYERHLSKTTSAKKRESSKDRLSSMYLLNNDETLFAEVIPSVRTVLAGPGTYNLSVLDSIDDMFVIPTTGLVRIWQFNLGLGQLLSEFEIDAMNYPFSCHWNDKQLILSDGSRTSEYSKNGELIRRHIHQAKFLTRSFDFSYISDYVLNQKIIFREQIVDETPWVIRDTQGEERYLYLGKPKTYYFKPLLSILDLFPDTNINDWKCDCTLAFSFENLRQKCELRITRTYSSDEKHLKIVSLYQTEMNMLKDILCQHVSIDEKPCFLHIQGCSFEKAQIIGNKDEADWMRAILEYNCAQLE